MASPQASSSLLPVAATSTSSAPESTEGQHDVVICVDAGGTKTLAVAAHVATKETFIGQAGCGNCATLGLEAASHVILKAVKDALRSAGYATFLEQIEAGEAEGITTPPLSVSDSDGASSDGYPTASSSNVARPRVKAVWIGSAGLSSSTVIGNYRQQISQVFQDHWLADESTAIWITNDAVLLSAPMLRDDSTKSCVCLIAGTGSAGFAFSRTSPKDALLLSTARASSRPGSSRSSVDASTAAENEDLPGLTTVSKTGGWGYLLGDRGSGWSIGLSTIQLLLTREEARQFDPSPLTDFEEAVCKGLGVSTPIELISAAYQDRVCATGGNFFHAEDARKRWLAEITRVVFDYAFDTQGRSGQEVAMSLLHQAVGECIDSISKLCNPPERIRPGASTLVLGGGLWSNTKFLDLLTELWKQQGKEEFKNIHVVKSPAQEAVAYLVQRFLQPASSSESS
ncbi:hypothetical protein BCV70DRAFT_97114 [Testicularia cyperi]|uniref:N-acetyl-D-glucosamine kinase n=1 Tax=Testicularia cyperi TaxID=1882483 RepID=A0A317XR01_9BASI|nr:hypothetical protein BCV70DRAFT_97114 [Testicularia cyperi]